MALGTSAPLRPTTAQRLRWSVTDSLLMAKRNLRRSRCRFDYIVFLTIQPVMFILLFNYVFGGAIATAAPSYADFLIPGIPVQTVLFTAMNTGIGLAEDLNQGMIDRYRSLPMSRIAVVAGRIIADLVTIILAVAIMIAVGCLIGFLWLFPLTFISSACVPVESMHSRVRGFAGQNPGTIPVNSVRGLALGTPDPTNIWKTIAWSLTITVIAVNRYHKV
jgi:hypothetical protein